MRVEKSVRRGRPVFGDVSARLAHSWPHRRKRRLADELEEIARRCASPPVLDDRSPDEIIGYDENGLPT
ncbi:MAG: type II toxin-antitoxin system VapB family antitoxin [Candidatus Acidiferrales bacterium]